MFGYVKESEYVKKPKTTKELIELICQSIEELRTTRNSNSYYNLWDTLSLIRGPDVGDAEVVAQIKSDIVCKIRGLVLSSDWRQITPSNSAPHFTYAQVHQYCGGHFANHVQQAERALIEMGYDIQLLRKGV